MEGKVFFLSPTCGALRMMMIKSIIEKSGGIVEKREGARADYFVFDKTVAACRKKVGGVRTFMSLRESCVVGRLEALLPEVRGREARPRALARANIRVLQQKEWLLTLYDNSEIRNNTWQDPPVVPLPRLYGDSPALCVTLPSWKVLRRREKETRRRAETGNC